MKAQILLATGRGTRRITALEPLIRKLSRDLAESTGMSPDIALVGSVYPKIQQWDSAAPTDIVEGEEEEDIITGPRRPLILNVNSRTVIGIATDWLDVA